MSIMGEQKNVGVWWEWLLPILPTLVRTLMLSVKMFFGPFVNDAVANMSMIGSDEVTKPPVLCTTGVRELEAGVASTRLLAYTGATWKEGSSIARSAEGCKLSDRNPSPYSIPPIA